MLLGAPPIQIQWELNPAGYFRQTQVPKIREAEPWHSPWTQTESEFFRAEVTQKALPCIVHKHTVWISYSTHCIWKIYGMYDTNCYSRTDFCSYCLHKARDKQESEGYFLKKIITCLKFWEIPVGAAECTQRISLKKYTCHKIYALWDSRGILLGNRAIK